MNASKHTIKRSVLCISAITGLLVNSAGWAVLPANATLSIDPGSVVNPGPVVTGSHFVMEVSPGFYLPTAISGADGLKVFVAQSANGSHSGPPNGSENPGLDNPWSFFGNTGMHFTATAATILSASGNTATLDFSGWNVTWNGISAINMGTGAWNNAGQGWTGNTNGVAQITCAVDCADGDTYELEYTARVPAGDPSSFGNVAYGIKLTGTISALPAVNVGEDSAGAPAAGALADGLEGGTATNDYQISAASLPADSAEYIAVSPVFDFSVTGLGAGASTLVTLDVGQPLPDGAIYRKYTTGAGWFSFDTSSGDTVESGASVGGTCLASAGVLYAAGLIAGNDCVRLTIQDGGINDADGAANGTVVDPGVVVAPAVEQGPDTRTSGSSGGCTLAARPLSPAQGGDWLLLGLALAGLAFRRYGRAR